MSNRSYKMINYDNRWLELNEDGPRLKKSILEVKILWKVKKLCFRVAQDTARPCCCWFSVLVALFHAKLELRKSV